MEVLKCLTGTSCFYLSGEFPDSDGDVNLSEGEVVPFLNFAKGDTD
jgi:hypothetical protein